MRRRERKYLGPVQKSGGEGSRRAALS
jgi:hypothetical protein